MHIIHQWSKAHCLKNTEHNWFNIYCRTGLLIIQQRWFGGCIKCTTVTLCIWWNTLFINNLVNATFVHVLNGSGSRFEHQTAMILPLKVWLLGDQTTLPDNLYQNNSPYPLDSAPDNSHPWHYPLDNFPHHKIGIVLDGNCPMGNFSRLGIFQGRIVPG